MNERCPLIFGETWRPITKLSVPKVKENIIHAYKTGLKTQYRGEQCSYATITNAQAEQIAKLLITKQYSHEQIANIVGCHTNIVRSISSGSTWIDIYNKYNLENYKKEFVLRLSDEDLHKLFKYFQDHKNINYKYKSELYRNALMELFGIEMKQSMTATLSRLHNRVTRTDISSQYDF